MKGSTYRRCACRIPGTRQQYGASCPKLKNKRHGSWNVKQELPTDAEGTRRSFRRGSYSAQKEAQGDLDKVRALLAIPGENDARAQQALGDLLAKVSADKSEIPTADEVKRRIRSKRSMTEELTLGDMLDEFMRARKALRATTRNGYGSHIRAHLKPHGGHLVVDDRLGVGDMTELFDAIEDHAEVAVAENQARREQVARCKASRPGRPTEAERARIAVEKAKLAEMPPFRKVTGAGGVQSIRRTLRAALNWAIVQQIITFNPAKYVELTAAPRPKPLLWTEARVRQWRETGLVPGPVMVWTPDQYGEFLDAAEAYDAAHEDDELYHSIFHVMGHRGLRRGEGVGQDWTNLDLDEATITPASELVVDGWTPYESPPKTEGSADTISLDYASVAVLRRRQARQQAQKEAHLAQGKVWHETGKVWTELDGSWLHPQKVSNTFERILGQTDLPPINLRDLRHVAASLVYHEARDIFAVKVTLRHSTIKLAGDTYTSLFVELDRELADKVADLVPRHRARPSGLTSVSPAARRHGKTRPGITSRVTEHAGQSDTGGTSSTRLGRGAIRQNEIKSPLLCQLS
ncbi:site-specific integrase [Streptomyces sp. ASQP_92]|nr:site-specific integrase [Streptomyces sp. ASQP_92]